ncbi:hypothetical protein, partial [Amycolatopsis solani]|uniref:hypothetical protein n=1 Tax=Amycolatopsis solani TaxID=3028615 RepID=UPI0025AFE69B
MGATGWQKRSKWGRTARRRADGELAFATSLAPEPDYWLHADDDGTPWLLVSRDCIEKRTVIATLRLDFDDRGVRGGWSPSCLNWDDGARAEEALIDVVGPDGLVVPAAGAPAMSQSCAA